MAWPLVGHARAVLENNVHRENKNSPYLPQPLLVKEGSHKVLPLNKGELEGVKKDKTFERCSNRLCHSEQSEESRHIFKINIRRTRLNPSIRKNRLRAWGLALLWLIILYATAPAVFIIVSWTRKYFSLDCYSYIAAGIFFLLSVFVILRTVRRSLRNSFHKKRIYTGLIIVLFATVVLFRLTPSGVAKIHLLQFGFLAVLFLRAIRLDIPDPTAYAIAFVLSGIGGLGDELLQGYLADRVGDLKDVGIDLLASLSGLGFGWISLYSRDTRSPILPRSITSLCISLIAASLSLALFCTLNPDIRFGIQHPRTQAGSFYSLLPLDRLEREDLRIAETRGQELDDWHDAQKENDRKALQEMKEQGVIDSETLLLFTQIYEHFYLRNQLMEQFEPEAAWMETLIGDQLYDNLLTDLPPGWNEVVRKSMTVFLSQDSLPSPYISRLIPEGRPVYQIIAPDQSWIAWSRIPKESLETLVPDKRKLFMKLANENFLSAYRQFLRQYSSKKDPFLREMRVHLFLRNRYAYWCNYKIAYGENRILETYFGRTLRKTRWAWPEEVVQKMKDAGFEDPNFSSRVGEDYLFWTNLKQVWLFCIVVAILIGISGWYIRRHQLK